MMRTSCLLALGILLGSSCSAPAENAVEVGIGRTIMLPLAKPARSVVVGDPGVADISMEGPAQLVVFGKRAGGTTLTVLGAGRSVIYQSAIVVHPAGAGGVTVTYAAGKNIEPGGRKQAYACAATCSPAAEEKKGGQPAKPASE